MADETACRYVFVAIDRATRWVFIDIKSHKTAASARAFLDAVAKAASFKIQTLLMDNGKEFIDRLFGKRAKGAADQRHGRALQLVSGASAQVSLLNRTGFRGGSTPERIES